MQHEHIRYRQGWWLEKEQVGLGQGEGSGEEYFTCAGRKNLDLVRVETKHTCEMSAVSTSAIHGQEARLKEKKGWRVEMWVEASKK